MRAVFVWRLCVHAAVHHGGQTDINLILLSAEHRGFRLCIILRDIFPQYSSNKMLKTEHAWNYIYLYIFKNKIKLKKNLEC